MGKFNSRGSTSNKTVNLAGGEAFIETPKLEFVSILLTSFLKDQFYRSENETMERLNELMTYITDKKFLAKAAVYARTKYGMRSISHVVAGELAKSVKGEQWTKSFYDKVVYRVDDITEILSYYISKYGKRPIPNSLKKGLGKAFNKFNEYQLAKYRSEGAELSLVDVVNLIHPKPFNGNSVALKKLIDDTLRSKNTWENKITEAGKKAETEEEKEELKKEAWTDLLKTKKIGYFALLRNLRNILEQAPDMVDTACELLVNEKLIKDSLVLPFRFLTAIEEIEKVNYDGVRKVLIALNKALDISTANVPHFDGKTLVVVDSSGSMSGKPSEIAGLFAAVLVKSNDADFMEFSDHAHYKSLNPIDSTLTIAKSIVNAAGGTNFHAIFEEANRVYDRVIILSDMQGWVGFDAPTVSLNDYKSRVGANPKIYSFDLAGHGTLQFPQENIYCLAGFSEKVFDVMKFLETDKNALITEIEKVEL
jgi:60 kDa SS-A/Ro ribonucleoprotein